MKKIFTIVLLFALMLILCSCGSSDIKKQLAASTWGSEELYLANDPHMFTIAFSEDGEYELGVVCEIAGCPMECVEYGTYKIKDGCIILDCTGSNMNLTPSYSSRLSSSFSWYGADNITSLSAYGSKILLYPVK